MFFFLKWLQCNVASEMQHPCLSENVNTNSSVGQLLINQLLDKSVNQNYSASADFNSQPWLSEWCVELMLMLAF